MEAILYLIHCGIHHWTVYDRYASKLWDYVVSGGSYRNEFIGDDMWVTFPDFSYPHYEGDTVELRMPGLNPAMMFWHSTI